VEANLRWSPITPHIPWSGRRGGLLLTLYSHSLTIALFVGSFLLRAVGGVRAYNADQRGHGGASHSLLGYLGTSTFWFESLQNWQSEFLSLAVIMVLSVFLRQRGSPEAKSMDNPHHETGRG
jgi:hypothetical protein